jgi:hypothetical protein
VTRTTLASFLDRGFLADVIYAETGYDTTMTREQVDSREIKTKDTPRTIDFPALRAAHDRHLDRLRKISDRKEPRPGDLAGISLEEEFEN